MAEDHNKDDLSGVIMTQLDNETPQERRERVVELEYNGPPVDQQDFLAKSKVKN